MPLALPWRMLISACITTILVTLIWLTSQFDEPPRINAMLLLIFLIIHLVFELIHAYQRSVFHRASTSPGRLRVLHVAIVSTLMGTVFYTLLFFGFKYLDYWWYNSEYPNWNHLRNALLIGSLLSIIFTLVQLAYRLQRGRLREQLAKERVKTELTNANLTILNQQLDPHFLFNNFNTLYYLIDENPKLAKQFLKNMSGIYRHILQNHRQGLIDAAEEYRVAHQYLDVLAARYERALRVESTVDHDHLHHKHLPPLVLQQLLENIVKHNRIDPDVPLCVGLSSSPDRIIVTNTLTEPTAASRTGHGLRNISARYRHLSKEKVEIIHARARFTVKLPLL